MNEVVYEQMQVEAVGRIREFQALTEALTLAGLKHSAEIYSPRRDAVMEYLRDLHVRNTDMSCK